MEAIKATSEELADKFLSKFEMYNELVKDG